MKISVVGLGKIGLPLAAQYASKGHTVVGVDINQETVELINAAKEPFPGEHGLEQALQSVVPAGFLRATTDYADAIREAEVVVVVVPLFVDETDKPDFGWMDSATQSIGQNLSKNSLVLYETTLPIGTTRKRWKPMLEKESGLKEGTDFHVVFSPERVLTGRVFEDLRKYPKLIGGLSEKGAKAALDFYNEVLDFNSRSDLSKPNGVWDLGSAEAAEMAKLAETTYRDVNIALANQFALHASEIGVDVYKVIEACNSQPYSHIHRPGISVGGHCIPVYPRLYLSTDSAAGVVSLARSINDGMPLLAAEMMASMLGDAQGSQVLVLGIAYRSGVKEDAFSGVYALRDRLEALGLAPVISDPLYSNEEIKALGLSPLLPGDKPVGVILHTDHSSFRNFSKKLFPEVRAVFDGRAFLDKSAWPETEFKVLGR